MAKILLVEDDKSLREIYGVRLMAEGYEIVSAGDGEEALAMAIKERPDLIVSDVMMPKISGFDMLDILRSTTETKDVKVIMMTALSSEDQRARGEALGADRYLVKSQVGIEDVVRTVHDVLGDNIATAAAPAPEPYFPGAPAPTPVSAPEPAPAPIPTPEPVLEQSMPAPQPVFQAPAPAPAPELPPQQPVYEQPAPMPAPQPVAQPAPAPVAPAPAPVFEQPAPVPAPMPEPLPQQPVYEQPAPATMLAPQPAPAPAPAPIPAPVAPTLPQPTAPFSSPAPASLGARFIEPIPNEQPIGGLDVAAQMAQALGQQPVTPPQTPIDQQLPPSNQLPPQQ